MQLPHIHVAVDYEHPIAHRQTADLLAAQGFRHKVQRRAQMDDATPLDAANVEAGRVFPPDGRRPIRPATWRKPCRRWLHAQGRMRPYFVVFLTKPPKGPRKLCERGWEAAPPESLAERPMKPFDFALRLRMSHGSIEQLNALLQEKHTQPREPVATGGRPPGPTVVHQHGLGHPVPFETLDQGDPHEISRQRGQRIE